MSVLVALESARTVMRIPTASDAPALLRYRIDNRAHLSPWEPLREESYYAIEHCAQAIADARETARLDRGYPFAVYDRQTQEMIATFNFANIVRGAFQACHLGYGVAASWQGRGLMAEVLQAGLAFAFGDLKLHRVMANYMPRNERSARLLERLGFEREGYAKRYLRIDGHWEDHVLTSLVRDDDAH
ncbi:MAG TPA: ribosomal protein S5-alanine N-acetyltransferase [Dyella sp.]|uniref:ribosomal protein S5-alanine N-acetyltransferase n=1 Tax=Dyella sp. TaxID=1869338 RepID=UPI002F92D616